MHLKLAAGLALALAPLGAADFWQEKQFTEWSEKQVRRILEDSPWARPVALRDEGGRRTAGRSGGGGDERSGGDMDMEESGGGGAPRSTRASIPQMPPEITAVLRWHSALPVKQAVARVRFGAEAATSPEAAKSLSRRENSYILGLAGFPAGLLRGKPEELKQQIRLKLKNKPDIPVAEVHTERQGRLADLYMFFPREKDGAPLIEASDGEVEVEIRLGATKISRKFKLNNMLYGGKLEI